MSSLLSLIFVFYTTGAFICRYKKGVKKKEVNHVIQVKAMVGNDGGD